MPNDDLVFIGAWVPKTLSDALKRQAYYHDRSVSGEIRHVIRAQIAASPRREGAAGVA